VASLAAVVETWRAVVATDSRSAKIARIAAGLHSVERAEIELAVHYLAGELPQGKLGVGYGSLQEAVGSVAAAPAATLTLSDVDQRLTEVQAMRGAGSARRRAQTLAELFAVATQLEQEFLVRLVVGELRAGALAGVMLEAIAAAAQLELAAVRRAAMYAHGLGAVARAALSGGAEALAAFQLDTLEPFEPMLAQTALDVESALERLGGEAAFEWKVDGARIQLHKRADEVRIFTRNRNDVTASLPEVVELAGTLPVGELVLDGETIALEASGRPRPFQVTMRRFGRRLDVDALRRELPLHVYFFDCLRLEAHSLAEQPMRRRWEALSSAVSAPQRIPRIIATEAVAARRFYAEALAAGHEGVMAKSLDAPYEAGNRGVSWLKIKHAHTLDLVVLAAEWGHGRRSGWLSNLHLGARADDEAGFVMLGKTFKGLTDAILTWQTRELLAREVRRDAMAVYVRPELVVEIAFNDIQASSQYPGGLALRFARVKRYRDDKPAAQADTIATVRALYQAQTGAVQVAGPGG
jgi:DNA ligase 1